MAKLKLKGRGGTGFLEFPDKPKSYPMGFEVKFNRKVVREDIINYLTSKRKFSIPESQRLDDYRIDNVKPIDDILYFRQSLNELETHTDVKFFGSM